MAILFLDSFDHYNDLALKWSVSNSAIIDLSGTQSRTGIGCCQCFPTGPELNISPQTDAVCGDAYNTGALINDIHGFISGTGVFRVRQVRTRCNSDGSVSVLVGNDPFPTVLGTSVPNLISIGNYAYVETKVVSFANPGQVIVRINGQVVLNVTGNTDPDGTGTFQTFYLQGPGSGPTANHDDIYLCNLTNSGVSGQPNDDFLGAIRNYAQVPIADASPLQWTPNTGTTHYTQVDTIPPPGDSSYVFDGNPGDVDQYVYGTSGIVPPVSIFAVQVCLNAKLDASGSRIIAPDVGGEVGQGVALGTTYNMVRQSYDGNPVNGKAWQLTDFGSVRFGPTVTA